MTPAATTAALSAAENRAAFGSVNRHILGTLASQVAVFVFGLITSVILNRSLGPEGKGVYAMVLTTSQLIALCASLGVAKSITFHLAQSGTDHKRHFQTIAAFCLFTVTLSALVVFALRLCWPCGIWGDVFRASFWPLLLLTGASLLSACGLGVLRGLRLFKESNLYNSLTSAAFLALLLAGWCATGLDARTALLAKVGGAFLLIAVIAWRLHKQSFHFAPKFDPAIARGLLTYGLGYFGYTVFQNLNYRFDVLLVAGLTNAAGTGCYTTATGLAEILWFLPNAIGTVLLPVIAGRQGESADQLTAKVCRVSVALMALGTLTLCAGGRWLVPVLYGAAFQPTVAVIDALAFGILTNGVFTVLGTHLASRKMLGALMAITSGGFAVNVLLNLWWIPRWGIVGAGLASTVSYSVTALLTARKFAQTTGIPWRECLFIKRTEVSALASLVRRKILGPNS